MFNLDDAKRVVGNLGNAKVILNSYVKRGIIKRIRRNLYCCVDLASREAAADRYVIGGNINESAYLTYHTAFEVHGLANQVSFVVYVASKSRIHDFEFENILYKYVGKGIDGGIINHRLNKKIRLTDLERTIIDSIDRLDLCGGEEELDEILKICPVLDEVKIFKYLESYNKNILYKKAGYFLERNKEPLGISEALLNELEKRAGKTKKYLSEKALSGRGILVKRWGLIVPKTLERGDDAFV